MPPIRLPHLLAWCALALLPLVASAQRGGSLSADDMEKVYAQSLRVADAIIARSSTELKQLHESKAHLPAAQSAIERTVAVIDYCRLYKQHYQLKQDLATYQATCARNHTDTVEAATHLNELDQKLTEATARLATMRKDYLDRYKTEIPDPLGIVFAQIFRPEPTAHSP